MDMKNNFDVVMMAGKQAGCIGMLSVLSMGCKIIGVVAYDDMTRTLANKLDIRVLTSIKSDESIELLKNCDLLISVHGREIVPGDILKLPKIACINAHPCLYKCKGANPVERFLKEGGKRASIGIHYMIEKVDEGGVIEELFVDIGDKKTPEEVYNILYPFYSFAIIDVITKFKKREI